MLHEQPAPNNERAASARSLLHLLLHCCHADGEHEEREAKTVLSILEERYGLGVDWFHEQAALYRRHAGRTGYDPSYLRFLISQIDHECPELLLWHCAQVTVSDGAVCLTEELMLERVGALLGFGAETCRAFHRLAWRMQGHKRDQKRIDPAI